MLGALKQGHKWLKTDRMAIRLQNQLYIHFHFLVIGLWTFKQPEASIRLSETLTSVALINHIIAIQYFLQYSINENKRLN